MQENPMPHIENPAPACRGDDEEAAYVAVPVPEVSLSIFLRLLQGDKDLLETLGLRDPDLSMLQTLPAESLPRLLAQAAHGEMVEVRLDRRALQRFLRHLKNDHRSRKEIRMMIEAEASLAFMDHFYGLSYAEYHEYRQRAGMLRGAGRPSLPDKDAAMEIGDLLGRLNLIESSAQVGPFDLLAIHQLTGYSLRDVWSVYDKIGRKQK